jgi:hypothetical protein
MIEIFVFGSNLAGRHGKGAALHAIQNYAAIYGQGVGMQGQSYAIPTKDEKLKPLELSAISYYVHQFINWANYCHLKDKDYLFMVTAIGCGLAGYKPNQIAPMFKSARRMYNIRLPLEFEGLL